MELIMYPGSFIWRRITDEWLVSRAASASFAISTFLIIGTTFVFLDGKEPQQAGSIGNLLWGVGGVSAAVSVFFLWGGMWRHWISSDSSSLTTRRVWFFVLLVGLWYGAIIYYLFVYLPRTGKIRTTHLGSPQE